MHEIRSIHSSDAGQQVSIIEQVLDRVRRGQALSFAGVMVLRGCDEPMMFTFGPGPLGTLIGAVELMKADLVTTARAG